MKRKTYYYADELNDDFAKTRIRQKKLGKHFKYVHTSFFWRFLCRILYFFIAPLLIIPINKIVHHQKSVNKKVLKKVKHTGYFVYSNHTSYINDCFASSYMPYPKRNYIIVHPDATSIFGLRNIVQMLGGIPLGNTVKENIAMVKCIHQRIAEKSSVTIFPEAHIWPYYTKIRPFGETSFKYPVKLQVPVFCITHCYRKRKFGKRPKIVSFVDGPFYPDQSLSVSDATKKIRDQVYTTMCRRTEEYSDYAYADYIRKEDSEKTEA